jgi:CRP-like cAMP-binding protein
VRYRRRLVSVGALPHGNALLEAMASRERTRVARLLTPLSLTFGDVLQDGKRAQHAYFPVDCMVSLSAPLRDHFPVEIGVVGWEGMVGVSLALGVHTSPVHAVVQASGTALRMGASCFQEELRRNSRLQINVQRYIHLLMAQVAQTAACNAYHPIEARCARWLLMTRDRMQSDRVEFTHELLARMLGVRRVGVTVAAGNLQRQGLIEYSRGQIAILDPKRLAKAACECYEVVKHLYDNPPNRL